MKKRENREYVRRIVVLAMFTAIVVVLQLLGSFIRFGAFSVSLVLLPIVLGAALYGPAGGAFLGFVFGVVVLLSGDAAPFFGFSPFGTIVTVLVKGTLAGLCAGLVYRLLEKVNVYFAVCVAAIVCPVVNTGVFLLGCTAFFLPLLREWSLEEFGGNVAAYMLVGFVGFNFLFELLSDIILSPVILRILRIFQKERVTRV